MRLDANGIRYMSADEFRVLTAVETGSRNHDIVPTPLIRSLSKLHGGGLNKFIGELAKKNLIAKVANGKYDGYKMTYGGYDYLALKTLTKRGSVASVGNQIGVGKESDIHVVMQENESECVLKIHRLGRMSFRNVKNKRDYLKNKHSSPSWMYMSRLSAMKEFAFMKILHQHGFPVPVPIDQNRHCILMSLIDAVPLRQIEKVGDIGKLYSDLMDLIVKLANYGLIHGDFNEFNILIKIDQSPILIDFPQMVSTSHKEAEFYFNRDVDCIKTFFKRKFGYESYLYPKFGLDINREFSLDLEVAASGFSSKLQKELEEYTQIVKESGEGSEEEDSDEESENDEEGNSDEENENEESLEDPDKSIPEKESDKEHFEL
ncbi:hypothetical protein BB559_003585 [Furculomyces boomerangus]|uniref:Serine/threonine-protein kinase RIO2 n=2 Tax=Harpellales TaxID=61421 RepID=A0A2T9YKG9_9FUNG|nr:hypothetical protein BB559_003585 [Furculomyces boomerangus]PWA00978.1 hypothetical protein BB558_002951 [Smittium angustum]